MKTEKDKRNAVLRLILKNAGKKCACPQCLCSFPDMDSTREHLEIMKWNEEHKYLMQAENIKFDLEHVIMQKSQNSMSEFRCLLAIAEASGIVFICPLCVDVDFEYFTKMNEFRSHCWKKDDERHMDFISFNQSKFREAYSSAMGNDVRITQSQISEELIRITYVLETKIVCVQALPRRYYLN
jgi:hypothetical protein